MGITHEHMTIYGYNLYHGWGLREGERAANPLDHDAIDETWKAKTTRDRKGRLPNGIVVKKVLWIEAPALWNSFYRKRAALLERDDLTPVELLDGDGDTSTGIVQTQHIVTRLPQLLGPCRQEANEHYLFHGP